MKRFTDTAKIDKEWYMLLRPGLKCAVDFLHNKCDSAGVWRVNMKYLNDAVNDTTPILIGEILSVDNGRQFESIAEGKIYCTGFIEFQYSNLSLACAPHIPVIKLLEKHGLIERFQVHEFINNKATLRKRVTEKKRLEIYSEDEFRCQYCGEAPGKELLQIDHIIALSQGGGSDDDNLTTACVKCNRLKGEDDVFMFLRTFKINPLNNLSKKLDRVSKGLQSLKEKEKETDKDKEIKEGGLGETKVPYQQKPEPDFLDWKFERQKFLCDTLWLEEYLRINGGTEWVLKSKIEEYLKGIESGSDFKTAKELKKHFTHWDRKQTKATVGDVKTGNVYIPPKFYQEPTDLPEQIKAEKNRRAREQFKADIESDVVLYSETEECVLKVPYLKMDILEQEKIVLLTREEKENIWEQAKSKRMAELNESYDPATRLHLHQYNVGKVPEGDIPILKSIAKELAYRDYLKKRVDENVIV